MVSRIMAVALAGMAVAACSGNPFTPTAQQQNPNTLASGGPVAPPPPDPQIGGEPSNERVAPGVANAVITGMFGSTGAGMDDEDKQRAYAAQL